MSSYFDEASLVMIPSGYKNQKVYSVKPLDGSGDLTFSRASSATRVASNGLIEKVRTNLILQSNTFSTTWANVNSTETSGQADPDGGSSAWLLDKSGTTGRIQQDITMAANEQTFSIVAKKGTSNFLCVVVYDGTTGHTSYFNLNTGTVGTQLNSVGSIVSIGSGWYRCSVTSTNLNAAGVIQIYQSDNDGAITGTTGNIFIYQSQFENGVATDYIATTTAAVSVGPVSGLPRLDYLNSTCPRLLLEPQRTNLKLNSENFSTAAGWSASVNGNATATFTANYGVSPDGYQNADRIQLALNTTGSFADWLSYNAVTNGTTYTYSVYIKSLSGNGSLKFLGAPAGNVTISFTTEWVRYTHTFTATGTDLYPRFLIESGVSSSVDILVWGAQLEAGAYATSYIPTLGTSVTRVADAASKTGISSLIGQTEGVVFIDFNRSYVTGSYDRYIAVDDNDAGIYRTGIFILPEPSINGRVYIQIRNNSSDVLNYTYNSTTVPRLKIAVAYKSNDMAIYINGTQMATSTSALSFAHTLQRVAHYSNSEAISQALLFKTRLTNAQLAELTTL
jgi:hypothetical protein